MAMELILLGLIGLVGTSIAPVVPVEWRLSFALLVSIPQLYLVSIGGVYVSMGLLASYFLWPEFIREIRFLSAKPSTVALGLLVIVQIVSWAWSPDLRLGIRTLVYTLPFFFFVAATYSVARRNSVEVLERLLGIFCVVLLCEGAMVVAFRVSPFLELSYLRSELAGILSGPNTIQGLLDDTARNNVLADEKAGGLFVNGNIAAAYLGASSFVACLAGRFFGRRILKVLGLVLWLSVFFTGSKAGMLLAVFLPIWAAIARHLSRYSQLSRTVLNLIFLVLVPIAVLALWAFVEAMQNSSEFVAASVSTLEIRLVIWAYSIQSFFQSPVFGQGFGGWQIGFSNYAALLGIPEGFPPHNTLIYLWSQSGLGAVALAVAFMWCVTRLAYQLIRAPFRDMQRAGTLLILVAWWLFIHGMGENWGLLGEVRLLPLFAVVLGLAYASQSTTSETNSRRLLT